MPLSPDQIAAGHKVKAALERADGAHPRCPHVRALHRSLAALRDAFQNDMSGSDFEAFGGGTPKDEEPGGGGG